MKKKNRTKFIFIAIFAVLFVWAFYNGLVVRTYTITSDKLAASESVRIVLITDLHSHIYGENQADIVSLIKKQNPDIIALAGDIADDYEPIEGTKLFLAGLKGVAPIYYVSGNHEFWSNDIQNIKKTIREYGVNILENSYQPIQVRNTPVIICGVDDPDIVLSEGRKIDWRGNMEKMFKSLKNKQEYKVLLAHRPELIKAYKESTMDLVVSGHAHGGQVRIPLILNGLYAPNQGWFPKYAGGLYKYDTMTHIVSRGASYNPRLPRVFNPPEVVVIDVKGNSSR